MYSLWDFDCLSFSSVTQHEHEKNKKIALAEKAANHIVGCASKSVANRSGQF